MPANDRSRIWVSPAPFAAALVIGACLLGPIHADQTMPNTLTPKEIEEGWLLLFDGETTFGWKTEGEVNVKNGAMQLGGEKAASVVSSSVWNLCELKFEFDDSSFEFRFNESDSSWFRRRGAGKWAKFHWTFEKPKSIKTEVEFVDAKGGGRDVFIPDGNPREFETAPIRFSVKAGESAKFRSIKLRPLLQKSLFNGKDIDGWNVFDDPKRNKSKWSVTEEGWLNVKNGPGDLQSAGKYGDFVLQLQCISNGKALNSGIFFRCIENEYQNGYEMQIQNGYKDNDRTKPSDFGTGAIYRRVPARKVVPNDSEWFAMTLQANGDHICTWVNGYQTVDWTDDRAPDVNPRKGLRTAPGHLSIQGHDPTTDLSFRGIKIMELKGKEKK